MTKPTAAAPLSQAAVLLRRQAIQALTTGQMNEGIALLEKALAIDPNSGELHNDLGTANWQRGNPERAEMHYRRAIQLQPRNSYALNAYGAFCLEQWRLKEADELLKRSFAVKQDHHETLNNIGLLLYRLRSFADAEKFLMQAIRLAPNWPNPYVTLGSTLQAIGNGEKSEQAYRHALKLNPRHAVAWNDLGHLYMSVNRDDEAEDAFTRCISIDPAQQSVWGRYLALLERVNKLDKADETLKEAKRRYPHCPGVITQEAKILRRQGKVEEGLKVLENCIPHIDKDIKGYHPFIEEFYFELGQLYDRNNDADKAFQCFQKSNEMTSRGTDISSVKRKSMPKALERLTKNFTADMAEGPVPQWKDHWPQPVFLVGFPRSGTTLLDQIMSSHPSVGVAEELPALHEMTELLRKSKPFQAGEPPGFFNNADYLDGFAGLSEDDIAAQRELFFKVHGITADKPALRPVLVDKLPLNIFHAGLIKRVFPDAKFILALRHPCDSLLSCFMQRFALNQAMANFLTLEDGAELYDASFTLWEHYRSTLDLNVHAIRYEDVVADFRPTVAALLDFLGLPWNEAVMEYDKTAKERGRIRTPSYHQVTEKIYTRAAGRWLRYRRHLESVLPLLAPHAERYGYTIDEAEAAE